MGFVKQRLVEEEEVDRTARRVLVESHVLTQCDSHELYFDAGGDVTDAYRLANSQISQGKLDLPDGLTRREFTDVILSQYNENSLSSVCGHCDMHMSE